MKKLWTKYLFFKYVAYTSQQEKKCHLTGKKTCKSCEYCTHEKETNGSENILVSMKEM